MALALAIYTFSSAWIQADTTPVGAPPDEWAHISYIDDIYTGKGLIPDYANATILPSRSRGNYLGHPPLYYTASALAGKTLGWDAPSENPLPYRLFSATLFSLGMGLWILAGKNLGLNSTTLVAMVAGTMAIPMFPYLAGSINNDNLGYLSVAISGFGASLLRKNSRAAFWIAAAGLAMALLTKATAGLFLLIFLGILLGFHLYSYRSRKEWIHAIAPTMMVIVIAGTYFIPTVIHHGSAFPKSAELYTELGPPDSPVGLTESAAESFRQMWARLPMIASHQSLIVFDKHDTHVFYAMLILATLAFLASISFPHHRRQARSSPTAWYGYATAVAFLVAMLATMLVHFIVVFRGYQLHGVFAALQPRYYNYALPGFFVLAFQAWRNNAIVRSLFVGYCLTASYLIAISPPRLTFSQSAKFTEPAIMEIHIPAFPPASSSRPTILNAPAGHVDSFNIKSGNIEVRGWGIDASRKTPAVRIWILLDGQSIGTIPTGLSRPDVANALHSPPAMRSGFKAKLVLDKNDLDPCRVQLAAEQADGSLTPIRNRHCQNRIDGR
ncbi:hypothetical protein CSC70_12500 [Pseudoxanthomonas kalamensis DSM 18571]|uniref:hypothetical protein n=1 Tax=Pseudoxanthomonas kalamensis TaxID=289483 RepID=UPI001390A678|nr:hypothetical protein [Pseudoxanthomonas kalamensis]KAF1708908.1 hypothetical protein CSC70_12500 [Pseudoxanthomonas kalamensis DSM 18571]